MLIRLICWSKCQVWMCLKWAGIPWSARSAAPKPSRAEDRQDFFFQRGGIIPEGLWVTLGLVPEQSEEQSGSVGSYNSVRGCSWLCVAVHVPFPAPLLSHRPWDGRSRTEQNDSGRNPQQFLLLHSSYISVPGAASQNIFDQEVFHWKMLSLLKSSRNLFKCQWHSLVRNKSKHCILIV